LKRPADICQRDLIQHQLGAGADDRDRIVVYEVAAGNIRDSALASARCFKLAMIGNLAAFDRGGLQLKGRSTVDLDEAKAKQCVVIGNVDRIQFQRTVGDYNRTCVAGRLARTRGISNPELAVPINDNQSVIK
jgi:hypothetical protein